VDYLKLVKTFLNANPNEVLTLLFTNPEGLSVGTVWKPVFDAAGLPFPPLLHLSLLNMTNMSGITPMAYVPPSIPVKQSEWPTLGQLIDSGRRVIVFLDSSTDTSAVNFILPEFQMVRNGLHSHHTPYFQLQQYLSIPSDLGNTIQRHRRLVPVQSR